MTSSRPRILYLINEAWFFRSHFFAWGKAARDAGFDVAILATPDADSTAFADERMMLIPSKATRGGLLPKGIIGAARQVKEIAAQNKKTIIHAFGLHGMAIAALARTLGVQAPLVISVTGLGFIASNEGSVGSFGQAAVRLIRRRLDGTSTRWLMENIEDAQTLNLACAQSEGRVTTLMGAGVDLEAFPVKPMPPLPPLKLILVARMVRSKGVDLAVAAVAQARSEGLDVTLTLVGAPDSGNPNAYTPAELAAFTASPGITYLGRRTDIAELLTQHHYFILPSRGGEGLPKALLEASAAGRGAIVSDVPGCRSFVQKGMSGYICQPNNIDSLRKAIISASTANFHEIGDCAHSYVASSDATRSKNNVIDVYNLLL